MDILYQDERIVVVDKPSGLLVHRSPIDRHETRFAVQLLRDQLGRRVYPVHRLDKGTSGALAFALDPDTARALSTAFAGREVGKTYRALVRGWPAAEGVIARALGGVADDYVPGSAGGTLREACTRFRRLACYELPVRVDRYPTSRYALLELQPESGRRHQLRRHLAHEAHPIVGDSTYGKGRHNRLFEERYGVRRLLLACTRLEFADPAIAGHRIEIDAPLAPEFADVIASLERDGGCSVQSAPAPRRDSTP
jgi:tRNA pseudouridine65 synthase